MCKFVPFSEYRKDHPYDPSDPTTHSYAIVLALVAQGTDLPELTPRQYRLWMFHLGRSDPKSGRVDLSLQEIGRLTGQHAIGASMVRQGLMKKGLISLTGRGEDTRVEICVPVEEPLLV